MAHVLRSGGMSEDDIRAWKDALDSSLAGKIVSLSESLGELTLVVDAKDYCATAQWLREDPAVLFEELIDLCGVDYSGFRDGRWGGRRFAVVSHPPRASNEVRGCVVRPPFVDSSALVKRYVQQTTKRHMQRMPFGYLTFAARRFSRSCAWTRLLIAGSGSPACASRYVASRRSQSSADVPKAAPRATAVSGVISFLALTIALTV